MLLPPKCTLTHSHIHVEVCSVRMHIVSTIVSASFDMAVDVSLSPTAFCVKVIEAHEEN